jgi:putative peptidoglycan lipid II flippase
LKSPVFTSIRIAKAAGILMLGNVASRLLGVVREQVIAALFGATGLTDAFVAASAVPTAIYDLLVGGAISAALIPVFSDYADEDPKELARVASIIISLATLALIAVTSALAFMAPQLVAVLGAGFAPQVRAQAISLVRLILPSILFMGLSGVLTAILYSRQRFALPAFSVAVYNVGIIAAALLFSDRMGITSLVVGTLVGALLQVLLQLPGLRPLRLTFSLDLSHPAVRRIVQLYLPVALGLVVTVIGVFIDRNLASRTGEGNMAAMRFATLLIQFPIGLVATAISFAVLPTLSRYATMAEEDSHPQALHLYKRTLTLGIKMALLAMLPAAVGLVVLRMPAVQLLYQRGLFDANHASRTALAFLFYSPQLPFVALDQILIFAFYARKNTVVPVLVGVLSVGAYLVTALSLIDPMGMPGLCLANAVQNSLHGVVLLAILWRMVGGLRGYGVGWMTVKAAAASAIMGGVIYWLTLLLPSSSVEMGHSAITLALAVGVGITCYVALLFLFRVSEPREIVVYLRERLSPPNGSQSS